MTAEMPRLDATLCAIDVANSEDPNQDLDGGQSVPKELLYGQRMSRWLGRLAPAASDALQIAARAQHIERWTVPRSSYHEGREGYHRWRTDRLIFHAQRAGEIMAAEGYDSDAQSRVGELIQKKRFKADPEAQLLEDVVCLVFLENYFAAFSDTLDPDKVVDILQKTWRKMSSTGHSAALTLDLPEGARALVERALREIN